MSLASYKRNNQIPHDQDYVYNQSLIKDTDSKSFNMNKLKPICDELQLYLDNVIEAFKQTKELDSRFLSTIQNTQRIVDRFEESTRSGQIDWFRKEEVLKNFKKDAEEIQMTIYSYFDKLANKKEDWSS